MKACVKAILTLILAAGAIGFAQASAEYRPDYCARDHDHRSHDASYYNYYEADKYSRAGSYRSTGRRNYDRGYDNYYRPRSEVVHRQTYNTRYRARINLVEEIYWTRSGRKQLVCSVLVKGPEAYYVTRKRLRRIARRDCSPRARIQYL